MTDDLPERLRGEIRQILTETCRGEIHAATAGIMDLYASLIQRLEGERDEARALSVAAAEALTGLEAFLLDRRDNDEGKGDGPWAEGVRYLATLALRIIDGERQRIIRGGQQIYAATQARSQRAEQALSASQKEVERLTAWRDENLRQLIAIRMVRPTYDDLCRLSVIFGRSSDLRTDQDIRINEWLKAQIADASALQTGGKEHG